MITAKFYPEAIRDKLSVDYFPADGHAEVSSNDEVLLTLEGIENRDQLHAALRQRIGGLADIVEVYLA